MEPKNKKRNVKINATKFKEKRNQQTRQGLTYDVLRIIFKYLNAKDLNEVIKVCRKVDFLICLLHLHLLGKIFMQFLMIRSWSEAANDEKEFRHAPEYHLKHCKTVSDNELSGTYEANSIGNEIRIKPILSLIFEKMDNADDWEKTGVNIFAAVKLILLL